MRRAIHLLWSTWLYTIVFACGGAAFAQAAPAARSTVAEIMVPAPSLEGNLLGTATRQDAAVYLPPGYALEPKRRYPVVYLLHGIFDNYGVFTGHFGVPGIIDRLIAAGEVPELIVVMPNGGNQYGGGFYRNSPVSGKWGDYIADDLVSYIDANYRTIANRDSRAIVGHSMGGLGALHLTMTRPEVFAVAWAMSPCCLAAVDDFGFGNTAWRHAVNVHTQDDLDALLAGRDFYAKATIGVATAFMPAPESPPVYVDLPFDIVRGEIVLRDAHYNRYIDALPLGQVAHSREALRSLKGLGIGVGLGDQFRHIPTGTLAFAARLGEERIAHTLDVFEGDHRQRTSDRLERVILPWVAEKWAHDDGQDKVVKGL